jgi:hypothetical protein
LSRRTRPRRQGPNRGSRSADRRRRQKPPGLPPRTNSRRAWRPRPVRLHSTRPRARKRGSSASARPQFSLPQGGFRADIGFPDPAVLAAGLESKETAMLFRLAFALASMAALLVEPSDAVSQDMLRNVDLNSPQMSTSELTRAEVEALLKAAPQDGKQGGSRTSIYQASTSPAAIFASQRSTGRA